MPTALTAMPFRTSRSRQLLLGALLLLSGASLQAADLFVTTAPNRFAAVAPGVYPLRVNGEVLAGMQIGDSVRLNLPDKVDSSVVLDRLVKHGSGSVTWIGHVLGQDVAQRVIITIGADGAVGQMQLADGSYRIEGNQVVQPTLAGEKDLVPAHDDGLAVPLAARRPRPPESAADNAFAATTPTRIDLMVLYTKGMVDTAAADGGIDAVIDNLIAIANQAYIDSGIAIQVHLVYKSVSDYLEDNDNPVALDDLSNASDKALWNVPALRKQYGADLVTIIRPLDGAVMNSCGVAWLGGGGGERFDPSYGYSVVSYGKSTQNGGRISCSKYTLVHELGHNMGAAHDRKQLIADGSTLSETRYPGAYNYSYGYGLSGKFGTIMSYVDPRVGLFSNPYVNYQGYPVGAGAEQLTASADNARTLNNTRNFVAGYMPMTVDLPLTGIAISAASLNVGATATLSPIPNAAALGSCSSSDGGIASVSGATVTALAGGTVTITCSGFSTSLTVLVPPPPPPPQAFAIAADKQIAGNGKAALSLSLLPDAADIGQSADLYLLAHALVNGSGYWFIRYANGSWAAFTGTVLPFSNRALSASEDGIVVFNGEFSDAELKALSLDIYLGYTLYGADIRTIKYSKAYSFR